MLVIKNKATDYLEANFSEDETAWDSSATYNYADEVRDGHYIYKYAGEDGTNTDLKPSEDNTKKWVKIRPTNYFAMLDNKSSTQTINSEKIDIKLSVNNYDSISLIELDAVTVEIELTDLNTNKIVYSEIIDLNNTFDIVDFTSYCFSEFNYKNSIYRKLPFYTNAKLHIVINNPSLYAKCGRLVLGRSFYIGEVLYDVNLGLESYSRKITDEFGNTTLTHINAVNEDNYEILIPTQKIPVLKNKAKELDAIPLLFVGDENDYTNTEHLLNFGFWEDFSMVMSDTEKATINLTIKGII